MYTISDMVSGKDKNSEWLFLSTLVENKKYIYLQNSVSFLKPMELFESWSWALGDIKNTRHLCLLLSASAASSSCTPPLSKWCILLHMNRWRSNSSRKRKRKWAKGWRFLTHCASLPAVGALWQVLAWTLPGSLCIQKPCELLRNFLLPHPGYRKISFCRLSSWLFYILL